MGAILVVNSGSSSIKCAVFDPDLTQIAALDALEIGGSALLKSAQGTQPARLPDHDTALAAILDRFSAIGLPLAAFSAAGHRVVHGGTLLTAPTRITPAVRDTIADLIPLAPLHNPVNLTAIDALTRLAPGLPQCASFDTAFHTTNPAVAVRYAIAQDLHDAGIRRYGFHGISFAGLVEQLAPVPSRLLACHLGNGASLCAILDGKSVATTMGYSPLSGLTMGTRSGDIDGNAVLRLAETRGIAAAHRALNDDAGLKALGGTSDMRTLEQAEDRMAVDHFCYWAVRHAGSMIAAMGGLDAIAFTGGIGENAGGVRDAIGAGLAWAGDVPVHVVPADEERQIARDTLHVLSAP